MKKKLILASLFYASFMYAAEVKIGIVLPLTGSLAAYGNDVYEGIKLANSLNPNLQNGDSVKIIVVDTKGDKIESANATTRLISQDKVLGLIGEAVTPNTMQVLSIAEERKIPAIAPVASGDKLLDKKTYASRVCFMDSFQGDKFANYAYQNLNLRSVAIIVDQSNVYSLGLAKAFEKEFKKNGGKILKKLTISSGDKDFKAIVSQLKNINPDFVYMPIYHPEAALIARQAKAVGFDKLLSAGDGVNNKTFIELGGDAVNGIIFTDSFDYNNPPTNLSKKFIQAYEKEHNTKELPAFSAMGADAYYVMINAMNECSKNLTSQCINDKIHSTSNFEGVGGIISIDQNGNASRSVVIKEIQEQKQNYKTIINP
ncbi:ABC transporter substrate-binding protein [Campylobacter insulaenigrae]|uniref:ABC transporter substrate-binding protein n=1 Tax=Campylobacter insulaenigrae TaxID=260714 RepID=UPI00215266CE|nr:ABC transporter substrate-binding protein [Campylobacter insulaenigrae]MCR6594755.1 ABC transporter substrate-binding protein [Campylobacter insulaenigrae]